jgi:glycosyltransferase involved in cell wall biosynthesis
LAHHIQAMLDNPAMMAGMRQQGLAQAQKYSWAGSAEKMITVYKEALAEA